MIFAILRQELIAVVNLSLLFVVTYNLMPHSFFTFWPILLGSLVVGLFLGFKIYQSSNATIKQLLYTPQQAELIDEVRRCGMDPQKVGLRYSYSDESVAMTLFNTVLIDPLIWKGVDDDSEAQKAKNVIIQHVVPGLTPDKRALRENMDLLFTPEVQRFIFRHELGHVWHDFSKKKVLYTGIIGAVAAAGALTAAGVAIGVLGGFAAYAVGILVGSTLDLVLSYASNVLFKYREEVEADRFAVQYSSAQEIEAAAEFFEKYHEAGNTLREKNMGVLARLPFPLTVGYPTGQKRAAYLKLAAREKKDGTA